MSKLTLFARLPEPLQREVLGGCQCKFCKAHPHLTPKWDTLAIDPDSNHTWTVHYPELSRFETRNHD